MRWGLILPLVIVGCARPQYVQRMAASTPSTLQSSQAQDSCRWKFAHSDICLWWSWENRPTANDPGSLVFKLYRWNLYDRSPVLLDVRLADINVFLWMEMPNMSHGSVPIILSRLDVGTFRADNVFFTMNTDGDGWALKLRITNSVTGARDEVVVDQL